MNKKISFLLKSLEKTSDKFWNISPQVGQFLNLLIKDRKYKTVLEIGTSNGYSGIWLAEAIKTTRGHLYTIESKKERFILAKENFKKAGLSRYITQILGHAPEDIAVKPRFFDIAFFDATKYEHPLYFSAISSRLKKGGMIITDNIISHKKELLPYLNLLQKSKNWESVELNIGNGLMVSYRIEGLNFF